MAKQIKFKVLGKYSRIEKGKGRVQYRPGDMLRADPETVKHFLDILRPLEPIVKAVDQAMPRKLKAIHKGNGQWVVINEITNDVIHEGSLTKAEAITLVEAGGAVFKEEPDKKAEKEKEPEEVVPSKAGDIGTGSDSEEPDGPNAGKGDETPTPTTEDEKEEPAKKATQKEAAKKAATKTAKKPPAKQKLT
jgi:hypothetical protein